MGGEPTMLSRLLREIDVERFDITLLTQRQDEFSERIASLGITVHIVPYPDSLDRYGGELLDVPIHEKLKAAGQLLQYNWQVTDALQGADLIFCSGTRSVAMLCPYLSVTDTKSVWNVGLLEESTGKMRYIHDAIFRAVDHVFIESTRQAKRQLTDSQYDRYEDKFTVIQKGIDTARFDPGRFEQQSDGGKYHVGTVALLNPRKRLEHFVDAAAVVLEQRSDVRFTIAGTPAREQDETYQRALQTRIENHGIADDVDFLGWVDDVPTYLNTLDVFVLPSDNEGVPGAVREALAMEVPTIATDVGAMPDVVRNGHTGFLIRPGDSTAIAKKIQQLLDSRTTRLTLGQQGRNHVVEEYSLDSYVEAYQAHIERIATL